MPGPGKEKERAEADRVAVVGGGFAGLMAARWLGQSGFDRDRFRSAQAGGRTRPEQPEHSAMAGSRRKVPSSSAPFTQHG